MCDVPTTLIRTKDSHFRSSTRNTYFDNETWYPQVTLVETKGPVLFDPFPNHGFDVRVPCYLSFLLGILYLYISGLLYVKILNLMSRVVCLPVTRSRHVTFVDSLTNSIDTSDKMQSPNLQDSILTLTFIACGSTGFYIVWSNQDM